MLEAEEVDPDFFTPSSSTSLANIFKKKACVEEEKVCPSLKYIPQLPPAEIIKPDESKPTQSIFACGLYAYEWLNNTYVSRGKLGFAIIKFLKSGIHNIVLYDSKKSTISCTTISTNFKITVKEKVSISYYDNMYRFWSIKATELELEKIMEVLMSIGVTCDHSIDSNRAQPGQNIVVQNTRECALKYENETSDTDSSLNRRTKDSILKRMANMGQSVLPAPISISKDISDTSDSDDNLTQKRLQKHKTHKTISRNIVDKNTFKCDKDFDTNIKITQLQHSGNETNALDDTQIVTFKPNIRQGIPSDNVGITNRNDLAILISEQRVSNSELRINMNKITDKLDNVLDKLKDNPVVDSSSLQFHNLLIQKLLNEYEEKIKKYEEYMKRKGVLYNSLEIGNESNDEKINSLEDKMFQADELCKEKDNEIFKLRENLTEQQHIHVKEINEYVEKINQLKEDLNLKNDEITGLSKNKYDRTEIKKIMNDMFQAISVNFNDDDSYSGDVIKSKIATIIKKTTIEAISDK